MIDSGHNRETVKRKVKEHYSSPGLLGREGVETTRLEESEVGLQATKLRSLGITHRNSTNILFERVLYHRRVNDIDFSWD